MCLYMFACVCVCVCVCYNREQSTLAKIQIKKRTFSIIDDLIQYIDVTLKSNKIHVRLLEVEYAKFSLYEKWNNCLQPQLPSIVGEYTSAHDT